MLLWNWYSGRETDKTDEHILYMLVSYCHNNKLLWILWLRKINIYLSCTLVCGWTQTVVLQFVHNLALAQGCRMVSLSWASSLFQPATIQICPSHSRCSRNKQTKPHRLVQTSAYITSTHMLLARSRHAARELHFILKWKGEGSEYLLDKTVVHCNVLEGDKFYGGSGASRIRERLLRIWEDWGTIA